MNVEIPRPFLYDKTKGTKKSSRAKSMRRNEDKSERAGIGKVCRSVWGC